MSSDIDRPRLQLVGPNIDEEKFSWSWFCGHCAAPPSHGMPAPHQRVCESCGFGLMQQAPAHAAPNVDEAFVIVDHMLTVQAMSQAAEKLLAVGEAEAVNGHVTSLLLPADAEAPGTSGLAAAITEAASGGSVSTSVFVRPGMTFGVRLRAHVGPCGPPPAALIVFR